MNEFKNIATIEWAHAYLTNRGFSVESHPVTQQNVSYDISIRKNGFYRKERIYGLCNVSYEVAIQRLNRMIRDFEKDYCTREVSSTCPDRHSCSSYAFRRNGCIGCSEFEKEKNKMKNIVFDISRDGPVDKLVMKDNVYDVCVKEVDSYGSPYDTKTVLKAEITDKSPIRYEPKITTRTDGIMAQIEAYKVMTTYNPDRKDSINEGKLQIKDVIFNPPATIVFWSDGSKTVVKAANEVYDPEKGLAMAIAKRAMGNQGNYFETFKKYVDPYNEKCIGDISEFARIFASIVSGKPIAKVKSVEETETGVTVKAELNKPLPEKPYRIWYSYYHSSDGSFAGSGVYHKEYIRKCDASRIAKKRYISNDKITVRWMVAQENPWISGEWEKKFGSDS